MRFYHLTPFLLLAACSSNKPLATVEEVDIDKYAGAWYEIERLPNSFEEGLQCVQAVYSIREDGDIQVENFGYGKDGWEKVTGKAVRRDTSKPGEIKVSFFWPFYGDYFILALDPDYQYVLVGSPSRDYLWILSRDKTLEECIISELKAKARSKGFDTSKMIRIDHDCPQELE